MLPAFALATAGASVSETTAEGFMSFQASRYFSGQDLFDPGLTHITFRPSMRVAGKIYHMSWGMMYAARKSISFAV